MATSVTRTGAAPGRSKASTRPMLSRDLIAETAMRLVLEQPSSPLTLAALGAELSADPTALYRHYRSREELLLDLVDRVFGEVMERTERHRDWRKSLASTAWAIRERFLLRPALSAEVLARFTGGPNERAGIEFLKDLLRAAGLAEELVSLEVRAFGEMVVSHVVLTASALSAGPDAHAADLAVAQAVYGAIEIDGLGTYEDATFSIILDTYLTGLDALIRRRKRTRMS